MEFSRDDGNGIVEWGDDVFDIQMLMTTPRSSDEGEAAQFSIVQEENCVRANPAKKVSNTDISEETSPLGLSLRKTPSLLDSVHKILYRENGNVPSNSRKTTKSRGLNVPKDERKAVNFPAKLLMIGPWKMRSRNQGDIVVKFYIAKEKLLWEILQDGLKKKIQFLWDDISAISAVFLNEKGGNLEVELKRQPVFYQEIDPLPRRPTYWETINDFTNGSASKWRRHYLEFDTGVLEKRYEKLLQHNPRLLALSRKPFCCNSPFFEPINLCKLSYPFAAKLPSDKKSTTLPHLSNEGDIYTPTSKIGILTSLGSSIDANYQLSCVKPESHIMQVNPRSSVNSLASVNYESQMYSLSNMPQFSNQNSQTMSFDDATINQQIQQSSTVYTTAAPIYLPPEISFGNLAAYSNEMNSPLLEQLRRL